MGSVIERRSVYLLNKGKGKEGYWKLNECQILIDCLFPNASLKTIDNILSIGSTKIRACGAAEKLNRLDFKVAKHWNTYLRLILLRYHYGVLLKPWKHTFLDYLISKKIMAVQDINFEEV